MASPRHPSPGKERLKALLSCIKDIYYYHVEAQRSLRKIGMDVAAAVKNETVRLDGGKRPGGVITAKDIEHHPSFKMEAHQVDCIVSQLLSLPKKTVPATGTIRPELPQEVLDFVVGQSLRQVQAAHDSSTQRKIEKVIDSFLSKLKELTVIAINDRRTQNRKTYKYAGATLINQYDQLNEWAAPGMPQYRKGRWRRLKGYLTDKKDAASGRLSGSALKRGLKRLVSASSRSAHKAIATSTGLYQVSRADTQELVRYLLAQRHHDTTRGHGTTVAPQRPPLSLIENYIRYRLLPALKARLKLARAWERINALIGGESAEPYVSKLIAHYTTSARSSENGAQLTPTECSDVGHLSQPLEHALNKLYAYVFDQKGAKYDESMRLIRAAMIKPNNIRQRHHETAAAPFTDSKAVARNPDQVHHDAAQTPVHEAAVPAMLRRSGMIPIANPVAASAPQSTVSRVAKGAPTQWASSRRAMSTRSSNTTTSSSFVSAQDAFEPIPTPST